MIYALAGGGFALVVGLIGLAVALARRAERAKVQKEIADEEAAARARADDVLARRVTRRDVGGRLRDGSF